MNGWAVFTAVCSNSLGNGSWVSICLEIGEAAGTPKIATLRSTVPLGMEISVRALIRFSQPPVAWAMPGPTSCSTQRAVTHRQTYQRKARSLSPGGSVRYRLLILDATGVRDGWTVGGGFAWMFTPHVSLGLDYNYIDLGSETFRFGSGCRSDIAVRVEPDNIQTVSARLTFYFNSPREPAPYVPIK